MGNIDSMIFKPPEIKYTVQDLKKNIENRCEVYFTEDNVCVFIVYPENRKIENQKISMNKYVVWSYGNSCNIYTMKDYAINFVDKYQLPIVLYDYIGYGLSKGPRKLDSSLNSINAPSEENCYLSLKSVMKFIQTNTRDTRDTQEIILIGHSLGTGVVIDYVSKNPYWDNTIILISPYKSIVSIAFDPPSSLLSHFDKFDSYRKISSIGCPIKIFHGINDTLINVSHSKDLYSRVSNRTYLPTFFHNVGHNDILSHVDFSEYLT